MQSCSYAVSICKWVGLMGPSSWSYEVWGGGQVWGGGVASCGTRVVVVVSRVKQMEFVCGKESMCQVVGEGGG